MDIRTLAALLLRHGLILFSARDVAILSPGQDRRILALQLHQWSQKSWIRRLKRGLYELNYPRASSLPDFYIANRLYEPSYVSLDAALSHYQLIPETAAQVTSVASKPTRRFRNPHGLFTYFAIRPAAFAGYVVVRLQGYPVRLAEPEKALVDRLYAGLRRGEALRPKEDRWDRGRIRKMDRRKLARYAALFGASRQKLEARIHALLG